MESKGFATAETLKKRICVIGGGPSALGALKVITETPQYKAGLWEPVAFESRDDYGGVWLPIPPGGDPALTPMYDSLTTNIPHPIMAYASFPFPPETPLYPPASTVIHYLRSYAEHFDVAKYVKVNTTVRLVDWDADLAQWRVRTGPADAPSDSASEESLFDLVIVANGHYNKPYYPSTPGLAAWRECGKAVHSASYIKPEYAGDVVLVSGAGPSGQDVVTEMATVSKTIIHSFSNSYGSREDDANGVIKHRPRVAEFLDPVEGAVLFEDGTTASGISHCIIATGYEHSLPFLPPSLLERGYPPAGAEHAIPPKLYNSRFGLFPLARQLFPLTTAFPPERMCFLALPYYIAPIRFSEVQTRAALRAFVDPSALDLEAERQKVVAHTQRLREQANGDERVVARLWHKMDMDQFAYRDELHQFAGGEYATEKYMVPDWEVQAYNDKHILRSEWKELVRIGEAERWVRGVGKAGGKEGEKEWVGLMNRLVQRAVARGSPHAPSETSQLSKL